METSLKQRLIGAAVLIALGVIFIPMLLDGAGYREQTTKDVQLPPEPEFTFEQPLRPPPEFEERETNSLPSVSNVEAPEPVQESSPEEPVEQTATGTPRKDEPPPASKPQPQPTKARTNVSSPPASAWVVQVGSFRKKENAIVLRDRLRAAGYPAFTEQGRGTDPIYRVKVGPEKQRGRAEAMLAKLKSDQKLKGIVITHP